MAKVTDYELVRYEDATYGQKWWCFMNTPKVKLLYKTLNELVVLVVFIVYSLRGQTYKNKKFDYVFYAAVLFTLLNNFRHVFFFFADTHTHDCLDDQPHDQASGEDPGEDADDAEEEAKDDAKAPAAADQAQAPREYD